jgi:hypothetical protein
VDLLERNGFVIGDASLLFEVRVTFELLSDDFVHKEIFSEH